MSNEIRYTPQCPQCGSKALEEVLVHVTQTTAFEQVICEGGITEPVYQNSSTEGGEVDRYQCLLCGFVLKDDQGRTINNTEGLRQWLEKHRPAE